MVPGLARQASSINLARVQTAVMASSALMAPQLMPGGIGMRGQAVAGDFQKRQRMNQDGRLGINCLFERFGRALKRNSRQIVSEKVGGLGIKALDAVGFPV